MKRTWIEPKLEKGENLSFVSVTCMSYATGNDSNGCPEWEKIVTLGLCK